MSESLQVLYQRSLSGNVFDYTGLVSSFSVGGSLKAEATKGSFVFVRDEDLDLEMGGVLQVVSGDDTIYYGFVFSVKVSQDVMVQVETYDALRYLKSEVFYPWGKQSLSERFREVCRYMSMEVGRVDESEHALEPVISEGKTLFGVLQEAIDETLQYEAKLYYVRAKERSLELIDVEQDVVEVSVDSSSFISGYQYEKTIDKSSYNQVHFWRDGDGSGNLRLVGEASDEEKVRQWGRLRLSRKVDGRESAEQLRQRAEKSLLVHGQATEALSLVCFGDWRVHAGCIISVALPELGEEYERRHFIVSNCTHSYTFDNHTMQLQLLFAGGGL